jgi:hypothetical protein
MDRGARYLVKMARFTCEHFVTQPGEKDQRGHGCAYAKGQR